VFSFSCHPARVPWQSVAVDGTAGFTTQPPPVLRHGQHLGTTSVVTTVLLALCALVSVGAATAFRDRAEAVGRARRMSPSRLAEFAPELLELDDRVVQASVAYLLPFVATGVSWIVWQRRVVRNAAPFAPIAPSIGWGTWGWFVPVAGLFYPQAQLANAVRTTDPIRIRSARSGEAPPILYCWWLAFSGMSLIQLGSTLTRPTTVDPLRPAVSLESFQKADQFAALSYWVGAVAAVLGLATVLVCTRRQRTMLAALDVQV
jgi:hypothetical protein